LRPAMAAAVARRLPRLPAQLACAALPRRWASTDGGDSVIVAYPGSPGSLSNIGAKQFFHGLNADLKGLTTIARTFEAVSKGEATFGVIPIENSSSGTVHMTYDLLLEHDVVIAGDLGIHEKYCLAVNPGVELSAIRSVTSHPVILDACSEFIGQKLPPGQELHAATTTTEAATDIASTDSGRVRSDIDQSATAAIATHEAAKLHGLTVLATDIGNDVFMETRYILIKKAADSNHNWSMPKHLKHSDVAKKHSTCFALNNEPGALFKLLSCWALRDINVVKIDARPLASLTVGHKASQPTSAARLWDHIYYIDHIVPPGQSKDESDKLWAALCEFSNWQRDFGTYSSLVSKSVKQAKTWDQMYQSFTWG